MRFWLITQFIVYRIASDDEKSESLARCEMSFLEILGSKSNSAFVLRTTDDRIGGSVVVHSIEALGGTSHLEAKILKKRMSSVMMIESGNDLVKSATGIKVDKSSLPSEPFSKVLKKLENSIMASFAVRYLRLHNSVIYYAPKKESLDKGKMADLEAEFKEKMTQGRRAKKKHKLSGGVVAIHILTINFVSRSKEQRGFTLHVMADEGEREYTFNPYKVTLNGFRFRNETLL